MCGEMAEELNKANSIIEQLEDKLYQQIHCMQEDIEVLLIILKLSTNARDASPHNVMWTEIIPRVRVLVKKELIYEKLMEAAQLSLAKSEREIK